MTEFTTTVRINPNGDVHGVCRACDRFVPIDSLAPLGDPDEPAACSAALRNIKGTVDGVPGSGRLQCPV